MCLNSPDSSSRIACALAARRTYSSPGVVNGSSALLLWQELVAFDVGQHQFDRGAGQIVLEARGDERSAAGLRVQLEALRAVVGAEHIAHADRPDLAADAGQRQVFHVQPAVEKERQPRAERVRRPSRARGTARHR